jgi:hypothetical protein
VESTPCTLTQFCLGNRDRAKRPSSLTEYEPVKVALIHIQHSRINQSIMCCIVWYRSRFITIDILHKTAFGSRFVWCRRCALSACSYFRPILVVTSNEPRARIIELGAFFPIHTTRKKRATSGPAREKKTCPSENVSLVMGTALPE